jgi:hypothetical protein
MLLRFAGGVRYECLHITHGASCHAGLFKKSEIAEPIDETVLPGAEGHVAPIGEPGGHASAVGKSLTGMTTVPVYVQFDIRHTKLEHGVEEF